MVVSEHNRPLRFKPSLIEKNKGDKPSSILMTVGGVFQRADVENANQRIYPKKLWKEVLSRNEVKTRIEKKQMFGMLGHPSNGQTDPEKVSHVITKQEMMEDGTIYGEAEILDTPTGRIAAALFNAGCGLGISSRGDGSIEKKGNKNEVQDDYQLETYDFVLKPSTPGAYPELVENVEDHEKLVSEAIAGLVSSEGIPSNQKVPVLTECLQILSVLEANNSGNLVHKISTMIQEELKSSQPSPILVVEADPSINPELGKPQNHKESYTMVNPATPAPQLSQDTLTWHQNTLTQEVARVSAEKDKEIGSLKDTLLTVQRESSDLNKKLAAAESLIDGFQEEVKRLKESAPSSTRFNRLQERYNAAVDLLDAALERLPEIGSLRRRSSALEGLLEAAITRAKREVVQEAIQKNLATIPASLHNHARKILESCSTPSQVDEQFKNLLAMTSTTRTSREPLPKVGSSINENQKSPSNGKSDKKSFVGRVGDRLKLAV